MLVYFVEPSAEFVGETNPYKKLELITRCCYKSTDKITEDSCYAFIEGLIKRKHFAMFEHITMSVELCESEYKHLLELSNTYFSKSAPTKNLWRYVKFIKDTDTGRMFVTGSIRAFNESPIYPYISSHILNYIGELFAYTKLNKYSPQKFPSYGKFVTKSDLSEMPIGLRNQLTYHTAHFITDRGITHEIVRHRNCGFAQESTRYVNYNKSGISFIIPSGITDSTSLDIYSKALSTCAESYITMIDNGVKPQSARSILPNCVKSEIYVTTSSAEWEHIFNLRLFGTTGNPHPDMKKLMALLYPQYTSIQTQS